MPPEQRKRIDLVFDALAESTVIAAVLDEMVPNKELRSKALAICKEAFACLEGEYEHEMNPEVLRPKIDRVIKDLEMLPEAAGHAVAAPEKFEILEKLGQGDTVKKLAVNLFRHASQQGARTLAQVHTAWSSYDAEGAEMIWDAFCADAKIASALDEIVKTYAGEGSQEEARADVKAFLTNEPKSDQKLSKKSEAYMLLDAFKLSLEKELMLHALYRVEKSPNIPEEAVKATYLFAELDREALRDMLANPLGQAQTAAPEKAEGYFRSHETASDGEVQNNFGYVYLTREQVEELEIPTAWPLCRKFRYMGHPYCAVPMAMYFKARDPGKYSECIQHISHLAHQNQGTPVGKYYESLRFYYGYGNRPDATVEGYHQACYDAELKWVGYARYTAEHKLPYIHIHPFEKYGTTSTKTHNLELGIQNTEHTGRFEEVKKKFLENVAGFLERSGITAVHPDMVKETLRLIESAVVIAQSARLSGHGTIAQNIPNEEEGRKDGIVTLLDTDYCWSVLKTRNAPLLEQADPAGQFFARYAQDIQDEELFLLHYILEIVSHELNHNLYKGKEQSFQSDGRGLAIKLIEEAKATNGIALAFRDPEHLTDDEIEELRRLMPLLVPWALFRLRPALLKEHESHQYLREGAVMLDHMLKSGVLKVEYIILQENGEPTSIRYDLTDLEKKPNFAFVRLNLGKRELQDYIARCKKFLLSLSETYYKTQCTEVQPETVVPDRTDFDVWQAVSRYCYDKDVKEEEAKGEKADAGKLAQLKQATEKIKLPHDARFYWDVPALIELADGTQMKKMKVAVARAHGLAEDDPALPGLIAELQKKISQRYPQIMV